MDLRQIDGAERGRLADVTPADVLDGLGSAREGRVYDFDPGRYVMRHWDDPDAFASGTGAGPDLEAATWLRTERNAILLGSDTPTVEQVPTSSPPNPHPVHDYMLRREGVHLLENAYLEELAADGVHRFLPLCAPLKLTGATASFARPVAVV